MINIYAYTTIAYNERSWLKIGQTSQDPLVRIKEQDGTSNPEKLIHVKSWQVPDNISDIAVHMQLAKMGINKVRLDANREWFKCDISDVDCAINTLKCGISKPNSFNMRKEQSDCVSHAVEYFRNGGKEYLMAAIMRFGKTFTSYEIARKLGAKSVLILTYKPAVEDSWKEELENHVNYDEWHYSYGNGFEIDKNAKVNIIFASFQCLNDFNKLKWKGINNHKFDLIIVDEMHYGSDTKRAKLTLDYLSYDKALYVSGTPLDALYSGRFTEENRFIWSYIDGQKMREAEENSGWKTEEHRWSPKMEIHTFHVCDDALLASIAYNSEDQFTMTKMFGSDNGVHFNDVPTVKLFIDQIFGRGSIKKTECPIRTCAADHMIFVMPPSINSVNAMCDLLKHIVGTEYHIINVAGKNISSLDKVKRAILEYPKTITVTCGRFNTGVTVPEWDAVFMLGDGEAPETYFQTIFRVQSSDKKRRKEKCYVFDFNPERVLKLIYTYCELAAKKDQSISQNIREFLDYCPVIDHPGNTLNPVDTESIVKFIHESGSYIDKFTSSNLFNRNKAAKFFSLLELDGGVVNVMRQLLVNTNDMDKGKTYLARPGQNQPKTIQQKAIEDSIIEKAKLITKNIPEYVMFVDPVENVESLFKTNKSLFVEHFKIELSMFKDMVNSGFMNSTLINRLIMGLEKLS